MKSIFCLLVIVIFITQRTCNGCQPCDDKYTAWYNECDNKFYGYCNQAYKNCDTACNNDSNCEVNCGKQSASCKRNSPNVSDYNACINISNWALSDCLANTCPQ